MQTILGTPYTPLTPEEMQALVRRAHWERAQALRELWIALFGQRPEAGAGRETGNVRLRPAA
jgi:hypothetical protein